MGGTLMEYLNRVGINSKPNGFPLIFVFILRKSTEAINKDTVNAPPLDEYWKESTMVAVDGPKGVAFYPNCSGFIRSEAEYMWSLNPEGIPKIGQIWPTLLAHESPKTL
ncbi:hypothetical protein DICVIV_07276 [Dictyocaulus viviparus]|uniref:Uncharacterized protein n=1 Tax=Dictyocaulus viviparus TaxID=29172 RepID=A0A0D8XPU0_DICVI|nr:hypothetical protein DICVIV_07276 [Dictyocaulus viviparus]